GARSTSCPVEDAGVHPVAHGGHLPGAQLAHPRAHAVVHAQHHRGTAQREVLHRAQQVHHQGRGAGGGGRIGPHVGGVVHVRQPAQRAHHAHHGTGGRRRLDQHHV